MPYGSLVYRIFKMWTFDQNCVDHLQSALLTFHMEVRSPLSASSCHFPRPSQPHAPSFSGPWTLLQPYWSTFSTLFLLCISARRTTCINLVVKASVEINTNQRRTQEAYLSEVATARQSAAVTCVWQRLKGRWWNSFKCALMGGPGHGEAVGGLIGAGILCDAYLAFSSGS